MIIEICKKTRMVNLSKTFLGNELENLQEELVFKFKDEFVDGQARLEYEHEGQKNYLLLSKEEESYTIPVKNVLTKRGQIIMQLVITEGTDEGEIPVFKSNEFYLFCNKSINAVEEAPDGYELWIEQANAKLNQIDNLNINAEKEGHTATITITRKDGSEEIIKIYDGVDGEGGGTYDYNELDNKPSINDVELEGNKTLEELGIQPTGDYALKNDIPSTEGLASETYVDEKVQEVEDKIPNVDEFITKDVNNLSNYYDKIATDSKINEVKNEIPDISNFITNTVNNLTNYYRKDETYTQEEVNERISKIPKMHFEKVNKLPDVGDEDTIYLVPGGSPSEQNECEEYIYIDGKYELIGTTKIDLSGIEHDIENLTELIKELQDEPDEIYVGYISSVTPSRNAIEVILEDAIKSGASTLMLRPTPSLPQDFTAIGSGQNLQKYKNGGRGSIAFTDINEHTTINAMPSVVSYITTVSFQVTAQGDNIDVEITDVTTKFVSGINSTSQQAYVLHTKNEEPYTPTKDYHPSTKKYVDDKIGDIDKVLDLINGEVI